MRKKTINSKTIIDRFELNIINKDSDIEYLDIYSPAIKRVGLELSQATSNTRINRNIISWGTTESVWFSNIGKQKALEAIEFVFCKKPPLVILSKGVSEEVAGWIVQIANIYKIPIAKVDVSSSVITVTIGTFINSVYLDEIQVHGCLVLIGGVGVLIVGPSGVGKSEATLDLVQRGHVFISDDAVLIKYVGDSFIGRSPEVTRNFLEVRGIGIIDVKYTYGINAVSSSSRINLVVELVEKKEHLKLDRLGTDFLKYEILGSSIRKIQVPVKDGGNTASLIETAVSAYLARHEGQNIIKIMQQRMENKK